MTDKQSEAIQTLAIDMWPAFIFDTLEEVDGAANKVAFDKFHIAKHFVEAVDRIRRDEHKQLKRQGNTILTGTKYQWLRNPNKRSTRQHNSFKAPMGAL